MRGYDVHLVSEVREVGVDLLVAFGGLVDLISEVLDVLLVVGDETGEFVSDVLDVCLPFLDVVVGGVIDLVVDVLRY